MLDKTGKDLEMLASTVIRVYFESALDLKDSKGDRVMVTWLEAKDILVQVLKKQQII